MGNEPGASGESNTSVKFDFEKGTLFRVIYVDGAYGGAGGDNMVHCSLFNTREPIPKQVVLAVNPSSGVAGDEVGRQQREGLFREIECHLVMTPENAVQIGQWLLSHGMASLEFQATQRRERQE